MNCKDRVLAVYPDAKAVKCGGEKDGGGPSFYRIALGPLAWGCSGTTAAQAWRATAERNLPLSAY